MNIFKQIAHSSLVKEIFLKFPSNPLFPPGLDLLWGNLSDQQIARRLVILSYVHTKPKIHFIYLFDSVRLLRKYALQIASNPYITFQWTGSFCVFDCTKLLKDHFILADQIQLSEIFASYFSGLDPFAGNLCMQLAQNKQNF